MWMPQASEILGYVHCVIAFALASSRLDVYNAVTGAPGLCHGWPESRSAWLLFLHPPASGPVCTQSDREALGGPCRDGGWSRDLPSCSYLPEGQRRLREEERFYVNQRDCKTYTRGETEARGPGPVTQSESVFSQASVCLWVPEGWTPWAGALRASLGSAQWMWAPCRESMEQQLPSSRQWQQECLCTLLNSPEECCTQLRTARLMELEFTTPVSHHSQFSMSGLWGCGHWYPYHFVSAGSDEIITHACGTHSHSYC